MQECLESKEYGDYCRKAKKLIWELKGTTKKSKEVSRQFKKAYAKIYE